ncbi:MAG: DTW domain-containing protein [Deltaproteobacteria bacterium]|nr:DTW domain-containing protein [Deltaproteobacteria bacterium]
MRKPQDICPNCHSTQPQCLCDEIPRLNLTTRVCLVIHHRELLRSSNTGLLALRALVNSEMRVRGEGREGLDLVDLVASPYRTFLFYPAPDAVELTGELVRQSPVPIQLIVPDGTWRQASKVHYRQTELAGVPRVKIAKPDAVMYSLRAQHRPEGMATLQAIAHGLGVIEGDHVKAQLMQLYRAKLDRALAGRGLATGSAAVVKSRQTQ